MLQQNDGFYLIRCFGNLGFQGVIKLSCESVLPLLVLADKYNVTDLMTLCLAYMEAHIATGMGCDCVTISYSFS
jgi:hypothetical protein